MANRLMVVYAVEDREKVAPIVDTLRDAGINIAYALDMALGAEWHQDILRNLGGIDIVIVMISPVALYSPDLSVDTRFKDLHHAIQRAGAVMIPVLLEGSIRPESLSDKQMIDFANKPSESFDRLFRLLTFKNRWLELTAPLLVLTVVLAAVAIVFILPPRQSIPEMPTPPNIFVTTPPNSFVPPPPVTLNPPATPVCSIENFTVSPERGSAGTLFTLSGNGSCSQGVRLIRLIVDGVVISEIEGASIQAVWDSTGTYTGWHMVTLRLEGEGAAAPTRTIEQAFRVRVDASEE